MERTVGSTGVGVEDSKVVDTIRVGTVVLRTLGDQVHMRTVDSELGYTEVQAREPRTGPFTVEVWLVRPSLQCTQAWQWSLC